MKTILRCLDALRLSRWVFMFKLESFCINYLFPCLYTHKIVKPTAISDDDKKNCTIGGRQCLKNQPTDRYCHVSLCVCMYVCTYVWMYGCSFVYQSCRVKWDIERARTTNIFINLTPQLNASLDVLSCPGTNGATPHAPWYNGPTAWSVIEPNAEWWNIIYYGKSISWIF